MKKIPLEQMLKAAADESVTARAVRNYAIILDRWDEICDCRKKKWSYFRIYNTLKNAGVITITKTTFYDYVRQLERGDDPDAAGVVRKRREKKVAKVAEPASPPVGDVNPTGPSPTRVEMPVFPRKAPPRDLTEF